MNNIDMMEWSASSMLNNKYGNTLIADCRKPLLVRVVVETLHHEEGAAWGGPSFMCSSEGDLKPASIHFHFCLFEISMLVRQSVLKRIARNRGHWKINFFHQFLPKLETHHNQFSPRYMVVLNMERVVIKKPNRMKLVPLGESEPPNLQLFPPYQSQGLTTAKWNSLQEVQKLPFTNYWSCLSWLYWLSSLSWLSCVFCLDCVLCLFCLSWQKTKIQTHKIEVKKFGSFCNLFWFIRISVFLSTDYLISPLSDCQ